MATNDAVLTRYKFGAGNWGGQYNGFPSIGATMTYEIAIAAWDFDTHALVVQSAGFSQMKIYTGGSPNINFQFDVNPNIILPKGRKYYLGFKVLQLIGSTNNPIAQHAPNGCGSAEWGNLQGDEPDLGIQTLGTIHSSLLATPGMQPFLTINGTDVVGSSFSCSGTGTAQLSIVDRMKPISIRDHTLTLNSAVVDTALGECDVSVTGNNLPSGISNFAGTWTWGDGSAPEAGNAGDTRLHTYTTLEEFLITFTGVDSNGVTYTSTVLADCRNPFVICDYNIDPARSSGDVTNELVEDSQDTNRVLNHFITGVNAVKVGFNDASIPGTAAETSTAGEGIGGSLYRWWKTPQNAVKVEFSQDVNPDHIFNAGNPSRSGPLKAKVITNTI